MTTTSDLRIDDLLGAEDQGRIAALPSAQPGPSASDGAPASGTVVRVTGPACRSTRAAMHDYLGRRLPTWRQHGVEAHMDGCATCIRAFIDIREAAWMRRAGTDASTATLTITRAG
ncbi:zf-HC2 domain-containing protein [Promicromonospora sp. NPDC023987]|uniref:zf-HC2 domain-containing protein n=1 Tax=Promicromonospora sp. NPDC023987 TaxID=3155360 RepID=UPI0033E27107